MPFDDLACFRLDRVPVRPIHWLWRPYLARGKLALLNGDPGAGESLLTADLAARLSGGSACAEGRPGVLAVVRSGPAARRRTTPMRVRPTDPRRAPRRPYGLARLAICTTKERKDLGVQIRHFGGHGGKWTAVPAPLDWKE